MSILKKIIRLKVWAMKCRICVFVVLLAFLGCEDKESVGISSGQNLTKSHIDNANNLDKLSYAGLEDVFLDSAFITHQSKDSQKMILLIFGKNQCFYCDKLKDDIKSNKALKKALQEEFNTYYINTSYQKIHQVALSKDSVHKLHSMDLLEKYVKSPLKPTPTLVFIDFDGRVLYELPGYIPPHQMLELFAIIKDKAKPQNR